MVWLCVRWSTKYSDTYYNDNVFLLLAASFKLAYSATLNNYVNLNGASLETC